MVPRYVELIEELPKTPTPARQEGRAPAADTRRGLDRVAAGVEIPKKTA